MYSNIMMIASGVTTSIDRSVPLSERLVLGLKTLVLGMGIVLVILALLWGILELFKIFFYDLAKKRDKETAVRSEPSVVHEAEKPLQTTTEVESADQIIAAITAAVSFYRKSETDVYTGGFRVVSFRKIKTVPSVRKN